MFIKQTNNFTCKHQIKIPIRFIWAQYQRDFNAVVIIREKEKIEFRSNCQQQFNEKKFINAYFSFQQITAHLLDCSQMRSYKFGCRKEQMNQENHDHKRKKECRNKLLVFGYWLLFGYYWLFIELLALFQFTPTSKFFADFENR